MARLVDKDLCLAYDIIASVLRCWSVSTTSKQMLFLFELEESLDRTQLSEFHRMQDVLLRRVAQCMTCPRFQVAEHTLFFWNNDYIAKMIKILHRDPATEILKALRFF